MKKSPRSPNPLPKAKTNKMYDLHTHSDFSDGTLPPEKLIEEAKRLGLSLFALTDHDTMGGVLRAADAAARLRVNFLPGIEISAEYPCELHILGLGVDPASPAVSRLARLQQKHRSERNARVIELLKAGGMDVSGLIEKAEGLVTKADIASAMAKAGFACSVNDAFARFLKKGRPFYSPMRHPSKEEAMDAIVSAGGVPVLAHPMKMDCDHRALLTELKDLGLWGIESYYSTAAPDQTAYFNALAEEFSLRPTCGSDFHGPHRPEAALGCAYADVPELALTEEKLKSRYGVTPAAPTGWIFASRRTNHTESEFQLIADRIVSELPEELFKGLNGGIVIASRSKLHRESLPNRPLYIMGEYSHGYSTGCFITLYFGSFMAVHGRKRGQAFVDEVRRVILHELRHHLEIRAGEHDLEYEDDACIAEYLEENEN